MFDVYHYCLKWDSVKDKMVFSKRVLNGVDIHSPCNKIILEGRVVENNMPCITSFNDISYYTLYDDKDANDILNILIEKLKVYNITRINQSNNILKELKGVQYNGE